MNLKNPRNLSFDKSISLSLIDKYDKDIGLMSEKTDTKQITVRDNLVFIDTRDCVGKQSLLDTQLFFEGRGGRPESSGFIKNTTGTGVSPITVTIVGSTEEKQLKNGDVVRITDVLGNKSANGEFQIRNVTISTFELYGTMGTGDYSGGGSWVRYDDPGYPRLNESTNTIIGNHMRVKFMKRLRVVRSLSLIHAIIPRDIIPLTTYFPDFIGVSTMPLNSVSDACTAVSNNYTTYIPQEKDFLESQLIGFYSTPIEVFRTYNNGCLSLPSQVTPSPLKLWNPPIGAWPEQPPPYPFQTVPTYQTDEFSITDQLGSYKLILAGYGVYDLLDWSISIPVSIPVAPFTMDIGAVFTDLARKMLLLMITPKQSFENYDYIDLIFNSSTVDPDSTTFPFGYGDYQRFVPGPGLQQNYQPGTSDNADPTVPGPDWVVPFPDFRGNVWGPYDAPGDRFQKVGIIQTLQDLFLNGDLGNIFGQPIVKENIATECLMQDSSLGINFISLNPVNLRNFKDSSNINIQNAMRILPNGFGTVTVRAEGSGNPNYVNQYNPGGLGGGGGIGPDSLGPPPTGGSWVNNPLGSVTGTETFGNPVASGPDAGVSTTLVVIGPTPADVDASLNGSEVSPTDPRITNRTSYYDLGPNKGAFIENIDKWKNFIISELPDSNIVINMLEAQRNIRVQGTSGKNYTSILNFPVRLDLGTSSGTVKYSENLQSLLASSQEFWTKRYLNPLASLENLNLYFTTYEGNEIPLEMMLEERKSVDFLRQFERLFNYDLQFTDFNPRNVNLFFLFNPLNPQLIGRMKRQLSLTFKIETYEYVNPGLEIDMVRKMLERTADVQEEEDDDFVVRASNYTNYS